MTPRDLLMVPGALASYAYFRLAKLCLGALLRRSLRRREEVADWKLLDAARLAKPLVLPALLTRAPRWNTHAVAATVAPFPLSQSLEVDVAQLERSAPYWSMVVYRTTAGADETVARLGTADGPFAGTWHRLDLPPGEYSLALRLYGPRAEARLPMVRVDGAGLVGDKPVPADANDFFRGLAQRRTPALAALNHYVLPLLLFRRWLPGELVHREFLPVGDPGNVFRFGPLRRGQRLAVSVAAEMGSALYATVYDRASFPLEFTTIGAEGWCSRPVPEDGYYLLRIPRLGGLDEAAIDRTVTCAVLAGDKSSG